MSWTSTVYSVSGLVSLPVGGAAPVDLTPILGMGDWSTRVAPARDGQSLRVFVDSVTGRPQLCSVLPPL